ncbi:amidohydrolase family protein [Arthrobacter sp. NtRootA1]|uniref:amidohydrolase family protein n=1 Tax=Arthrobacter sp. NtRootA1 TaxID=2830983 RepID=UPI001E7B4642|nr:amidohydrolase family protein [Arthrobacter sp. NtRootA1]BCW07104.1 hypothetical protein NtRootA1_32420 [Arthrobacter sp. NtRootA1]
MQELADLVIVNASVHTMDPAKPDRMSDALAIRDGRILAIGSTDTARAIGPNTVVVDAAGGALIPAINDAHLHFVSAAMAAFGYVRLDPSIAPDWAAVVEIINSAPAGEDGWVRAHGWDEALLGPASGYLLDCRPVPRWLRSTAQAINFSPIVKRCVGPASLLLRQTSTVAQ